MKKTAGNRDSGPDDPETIRKDMTETRAAMTRKLGAIQSRLTGTPSQGVEEGETVAAKKANGTSSKESMAGGARASSRDHTGKRRKGKSAGARTANTMARKSKATSSSKKKSSAGKRARTSKAVDRTKEVLSEVLTGAAAGAVKAAAQVVAARADQVLEEQKGLAGRPPPAPAAPISVDTEHRKAAPAPRPPVM